jgi:hypothetical protein
MMQQQAGDRALLKRQAFVKYFAGDLPVEEARVLAAVQGPTDNGRSDYQSGPPAWRQIDNLHYVRPTEDQLVHPQLQKFLAKRMGAKRVDVEVWNSSKVSGSC